MEERIFAGLIQIKAMMSVLERRDFQPARDQTRNQLGDKRGFAGTAPARETDNAHGPLYSKTPGRKGRLLTRRIVLGVSKADELGDLDPTTARLLRQIATAGGTLRASRLTEEFARKGIKLRPGTVLMREWKATYRVMVVDDGFAWNGKTYDSLSKVAFAITGTNWNGPRFFGLRDKISPEAKS